MDRTFKTNMLGSDAGILITQLSHLSHILMILHSYVLENIAWIRIDIYNKFVLI